MSELTQKVVPPKAAAYILEWLRFGLFLFAAGKGSQEYLNKWIRFTHNKLGLPELEDQCREKWKLFQTKVTEKQSNKIIEGIKIKP